MISKILVAMDGSESSLRAYEYASFLAKRCDAALIIVNICDIFEKITGEIKRELGDIARKIDLIECPTINFLFLAHFCSITSFFQIRSQE